MNTLYMQTFTQKPKTRPKPPRPVPRRVDKRWLPTGAWRKPPRYMGRQSKTHYYPEQWTYSLCGNSSMHWYREQRVWEDKKGDNDCKTCRKVAHRMAADR